MIMLEDLVDRLNGSIVKQLVPKKFTETIYVHRPSICPHCHSDEMVGVEVMGCPLKVLIWECEECSNCFLRFSSSFTEGQLKKVKIYWTNKSDWGYHPKSQYN